MTLSNCASFSPGSFSALRKKLAKSCSPFGRASAWASVSPSDCARYASERMADILANPSFTMAAIGVATAKSRTSGFFRISASAMRPLSVESALRIDSPGRFTTTSATIVSSENTRSATKSLMAAIPPMSRGTIGAGPDGGGGIACCTSSALATIGADTLNSLCLSSGSPSGMFATCSSMAFMSSGSPALSRTSLAWYSSSLALVLIGSSSFASARSAISTSMPVL